MPHHARTRFRPWQIDRAQAARALDEARDHGVDVDSPDVRDLVGGLGAGAGAVLPSAWRVPALLPALARELSLAGFIAPAGTPPRLDDDTALDDVKRALRRYRDEALVRTALRELYAVADVDGTAREWSRVASWCTATALRAAQAHGERRDGAPLDPRGQRVPFAVLGMGKLGGGELNLGSDIDICFFYGTDEGAAGERTLHQHFGRVGSTLSDLLGDVTEDGFAFRVDLRLRPEGRVGPVANSLAAAERYYETWGRTWERAALLRSRAIAGDEGFGVALRDALRPFIFRRAVEPSIALEMSAMLDRARRELLRDDARDLKLGLGGIRELEFYVQILQLIWGGTHPSLQVTGTLDALTRLHALGLVSHRDRRDLDEAWGLLRRVEHRVQVMTAYATHELPAEPDRRDALARSLGYAVYDDLDVALRAARARVHAMFLELLPAAAPSVADDPMTPLAARVAAGASASDIAALAGPLLGVQDPDGAAQDLLRLARRADLPLGAVMFDREPAFAPWLLNEIAEAPAPDRALSLLADFFARSTRPEQFARWLWEHRDAGRGLIGLFGASEHLARAVLARPELVDSVARDDPAPSPEAIDAYVRDAVDVARREEPDDLDAAVGAMRRALREVTLTVGLADMRGELSVHEVTRRLSALAESVVRACLSIAADECAARYGAPAEGEPLRGVAVLALGSLAGWELGHGGDLDLLFVFEREGETAGGSRGAITLGEHAVRLTQRTLSLLSSPHADGPGYATDTRLRPAGSQGTLVSTRDAFVQHHAASASWERQALLRARVVAGDPAFGAAMTSIVAAVAYDRGPADLAELRRLRARMELELGREDRGEVALKYGRGGLVDVEFAAQALQMRHGADARVRTPNTRDALRALRASGHLDDATAAALLDAEQRLRTTLMATRLATSHGHLVPSSPSALTVARRLGYRAQADRSALEVFLGELAVTRDAARRAFRAVLDGLERGS